MNDYRQHDPEDGSGKFVALVVSLVLLLVLLGGYFGYHGIKGLLVDLREKYTDTSPLELPEFTSSDEASEAVLARVDRFADSLKTSTPDSPLILSGEDINILVNRHPAWEDLAGKLHVEIDQDRLLGTISVPLDPVSGFLEGRFLNGNAVFRISLSDDVLQVHIDSVEIGGDPLPDKLMESIRANNLADEANQDQGSREVFQKLESVTVKDGRLTITPKSNTP